MTQKCVCVNVIILSSVPRERMDILRQFHKVNSVLIRHASLDSEHLESGQHGSKRVSGFFGGSNLKKLRNYVPFLRNIMLNRFAKARAKTCPVSSLPETLGLPDSGSM